MVTILVSVLQVELEALANLEVRTIVIVFFIGAHHVRECSPLFLLWRHTAFLLRSTFLLLLVNIKALEIVGHWSHRRCHLVVKLECTCLDLKRRLSIFVLLILKTASFLHRTHRQLYLLF